MPVIALQGINSGTGTTSLTAGLAWALHRLGESVLLLDFSANNMLRLQFNTAFELHQGWARALIDKTPWQQSALRYVEGLDFIPFGTLSKEERLKLDDLLKKDSQFWSTHLSQLAVSKNYNWILLDLPAEESELTQQAISACDHIIFLLNADVNNHIRIHQQALPEHCQFLINKFSPLSQLQRDIHKLWMQALPNLIPMLIHLDEALAESPAAKQPVGEYSPQSLAAEELITLANWCLLSCSESVQ